MRQFLKRLAIALLPVLLMGGFNFFRDRAHIVRSESFISGVRDSMQGGRQVAGLEDYNERALARQIAQQYATQPDVLILGSSRSAELTAWMCGGKDVLNLSVSGASWQDHVGLYIAAGQSGKLALVKKLYLCVDPWLLNPNNGEVRWQTLNDEVARAARNWQIKGYRSPYSERQWMAKLREMFNPLYAWENLTQAPVPFFATTDTVSTHKLVFSNGSIRQQKEKDARGLEESRERAREFASHGFSLSAGIGIHVEGVKGKRCRSASLVDAFSSPRLHPHANRPPLRPGSGGGKHLQEYGRCAGLAYYRFI
jgi:hypothetical protein